MLAVDYFSSEAEAEAEAEARGGEQSEPPQDVAEAFRKWMAQMSDEEWMDLAAPDREAGEQPLLRTSETGRRSR